MATGTIKAVALKSEVNTNASNISTNTSNISTLKGAIAIVINGSTASVNVSSGQYVVVINSTISGITDGLYKATAAVTAGTAFTSAKLTAVSNGGFNALNSGISTNTTNILTTQGEIATVINGNKASSNVVSGQYVVVANSSISGISNGFYKATANVNSGTAFTSSNLSAISNGVANELAKTMTAASSSTAGTKGLVPAPASGKQDSFLRGDATWAVPSNTWRGYQIVRYSFSWSCSGSTYVDIAQGASGSNKINVAAISGYEPVAVLRLVSGDANVIVSAFNFHDYSGSTSVIRLRNISSSSKSATRYASVLWLKTDS